ncbi:glutamate synthase-related protein [Micromonospora sp. AKA38]|uniref:glutamate synthase-related protein n=1 Tax=Micromonospora sp. AKA38 TaxID=2733861 RepID=UPI0022CB4FC7|nr:glutamate synthase-related protein [Micromonospora sp. AKA38]GHJ15502.1 glutamate synthase [Micromonospora sp. AKA38]
MTNLRAPGFPEDVVRRRARHGRIAVFPDFDDYGSTVLGADVGCRDAGDPLDQRRLVPPVLMPGRLTKLIETGREPLYDDVGLEVRIGGFRSALPVYVSALGSTKVATVDLGASAARQAGRCGIPIVIGENISSVNGFGRLGARRSESLLGRIAAYTAELADGLGGVAVQQSTEDADTEAWNMLYTEPSLQPLLDSGRLAFELKVGQGAKPGLGGMTLLEPEAAERVADRFHLEAFESSARLLRSSSPGTFTSEILRQQIRFMRNNFPRARCWVKLPPGRDVGEAATIAWAAGADAVTVDGAEGGTGWAPLSFLAEVGLPLGECLRRIGVPVGCLLASGRMWEGARMVKALAAGVTAVGLGRAALIAADEDDQRGLERLLGAAALEIQMLTSSLGVYHVAELGRDALWPALERPLPEGADSALQRTYA